MRYVGDFHIHSHFSRATSRDMNIEELDKWARIKGVKILGTGDFTHPKWFYELKDKLEPKEEGLYSLKNSDSSIRFILTVEVSSIYSEGGKVRRIHNIVFAPSFKVASKINKYLGKVGNLRADGRPILGLPARELLKVALDASPNCLLVPAHCLLPSSIIHTKDDLVMEIKNIKVGDEVLTHQGRWKTVREVLARSYKGTVRKVQPYYFREGLTTTLEHPFYAIKTKKNCCWNNGICKPQHRDNKRCVYKYFEGYKAEWIPAKDLKVGDILIYPRLRTAFSAYTTFDVEKILDNVEIDKFNHKVRFPGTRSYYINSRILIDKNFCRLAGYYLAEGYGNGRDAIGFTFHEDEYEYIKEVIRLVKDTFGFTGKAKVRKLQSKGTEVIFYSKVLYKIFSKIFYGESRKDNAKTKALPSWVLGLKPELQVEIFRCWWRGDKGYTTSRVLMNQIKIILLRLGIIPSIYQDTQKSYEKRGKHFYGGRRIVSNATTYSINRLSFFEDTFNLLSEPEFQQFRSRSATRHGWMDEEYIYIPIRDITTYKYKGEVYNLEVEDDNSYTSEFVTVHNCWTPWFSIFGSKSGYDSIEECFGDMSEYIFAIETGLSSDPAMNWRLSALDNITLISNSDCHSAKRIGREANIFEGDEISYKSIVDAIKYSRRENADKLATKLVETIEFFPEEGKYHYDGHRLCDVRLKPEESRKINGICPKCNQPLTIGVLSRVEDLADRPEGFIPKNAIPFRNLVPLDEVIGEAIGVGANSKSVLKVYNRLIEEFGNEFSILLNTELLKIEEIAGSEVSEALKRVRVGNIFIEPGYDGEYGKVRIFKEGEIRSKRKQQKLF